jgi:hypothetical protein
MRVAIRHSKSSRSDIQPTSPLRNVTRHSKNDRLWSAAISEDSDRLAGHPKTFSSGRNRLATLDAFVWDWLFGPANSSFGIPTLMVRLCVNWLFGPAAEDKLQ